MAARKIRKAVFPVAGLGTRFLPATKALPKEMLPLVDQPIIQYAVEEARASGLEAMILVTGRGKGAIEDHFDASYELEKVLEQRGKLEALAGLRQIREGLRFSSVRQHEALGLGHAVLQARELVGSEPFAVLLPDDIIEAPVPCLRQMLDVFEQYGEPVLALCEVPGPEISAYGVIAGSPVPYRGSNDRLYQVSQMVEKPPTEQAPSHLAIIGRYLLTPEIFEDLERTKPGRGGEIQLTDGLRGLLARGGKIYGYRFEGRRHDAGDKLGFLIATVELALKRRGLGEQFREYLKRLQL